MATREDEIELTSMDALPDDLDYDLEYDLVRNRYTHLNRHLFGGLAVVG